MWSPLADLSSSENLTASQKLPFPTGIESKIKTNNSQDSFYATYDDYIRDLFETETETVERDGFQYEEEITDDKGRPILQLKAPTPENLELLAEFIEQINQTGFTFKGKQNSKGNWIPTDEAIAEWENNNYVLKDLGFKTVEDAYEAIEQIKNLINYHNLYIRTAPTRTREQMAKNKCQYEMYQICSTASNLVELMVGLDVATSVLKDPKTGAVALSPYNGDDKHSAPGNYFTINQSCQEGQVGKDCVGIGAVSIKVNSTTQYYADKILWKGTAEDKQRLILPKVDEWGNRNDKKGDNCYILGGVPRYGLYNLYDKNAENGTSNNSVEIIKLLDSIQTEDDITPNVSLSLAAMLSVAVDNAKDLALAKINAGPKMFGFYAYGISMGMDIRDIARIVNTPQGRIITKLCEGDITNGQMGAFSALQAIKKLEGNISRDLTQFDVQAERDEGVKGAITIGDRITRRTASEVVQTLFAEYYTNVAKKKYYWNLIKIPFVKRNKGKISEDVTDLSNIVYQISSIGKMDECIQYVKNHPLWGQINVESSFLYNKQDWQASIYQLLEYCQKYGNLVKTYYSSDNETPYYYAKNLRILAQGAEEMRILGTILSSNKGLKTKAEDGINFVKTIENAVIDRKKTMGIESDPKEDHIDFVLFATDADYRKQAIYKYEAVKHTTNILDVVANAPHFLSYLRACAIPQAAFKMGSVKFRARETYYDQMADKIVKVSGSVDKAGVARGIENAVTYRMFKEWLAQEHLEFMLPKGSKMFVNRAQEPFVIEEDTPIPLWTDNGLATFKLYMDSQVIPTLKSNPKYSYNTFVQGLIPFELTKTGTHAAITAYTLEGNMMPFTEAQTMQMENYMADFMQMYGFRFPNSKGSGINSITNYADAFYIYAQYVFNGKKGQRSLMGLFDSENCALAKHFEQFEAKIDAETDYEFKTDELAKWCSPNSNIYNPSAQSFYATDNKHFGRQYYIQTKKTEDAGDGEHTITKKVIERADNNNNITVRQNYTNPETEEGRETPNRYISQNTNVKDYVKKYITLDESSGESVQVVANPYSGTYSLVPEGQLSPRSTRILEYLNDNISMCYSTDYDWESHTAINTIDNTKLQAMLEKAIDEIDNNCGK